jgi:hypothetical protein
MQNLERPPGVFGKGSSQVLVNGNFTPTITMRPGEVQLWRFVNATEGNGAGVITAGTSKAGVFEAPQFNFVQTAQDGVQFSPTKLQCTAIPERRRVGGRTCSGRG